MKEDLVKFANLFSGDGTPGKPSRLKLQRLLMTDNDANYLNTWTLQEVGDAIASMTTTDGYKRNTVMGYEFTRTIKTDILRPGNIYGFTAPEFFGAFYIKDKVRFYEKQERNRLSFEAWESVGMYMLPHGIRKLELFAGSTDEGVTGNSAVLRKYTPVSEQELGAMNNRVDYDQTFPHISDF